MIIYLLRLQIFCSFMFCIFRQIFLLLAIYIYLLCYLVSIPHTINTILNFSSQLQLSLELRNCFPSVRTYDATNLGQFLSDHFHIAYGTFYQHCECFYRKQEKKKFLGLGSFYFIFGPEELDRPVVKLWNNAKCSRTTSPVLVMGLFCIRTATSKA